jgi:predicted SAM-dependent methyltransferase
MLKESWRVLKNGRKMGISTPNLAFLIALYKSEGSELQEEYIQRVFKGLPCRSSLRYLRYQQLRRGLETRVYLRRKGLRLSMEQAGFVEIAKAALNESEDPALRNLENEHRSPPGFIRLESLILEGTKRTSRAPH